MLVGLARVYHMTLQAGTGAVHHRTGQEALLLGIVTPRNPEKLKFGAQQTATSSWFIMVYPHILLVHSLACC